MDAQQTIHGEDSSGSSILDPFLNSGILLTARAFYEFGTPYMGGQVTADQLFTQFGGDVPSNLTAWIAISKPKASVGEGDVVVLAQVMPGGDMTELARVEVSYGKMLAVPGIHIDPNAGGVAFFTQSADTTAVVQWTGPSATKPPISPGESGSGVETQSWADVVVPKLGAGLEKATSDAPWVIGILVALLVLFFLLEGFATKHAARLLPKAV